MKLTIVGQGIHACHQITLEGLNALQESTKILYLSVNSHGDIESFFKKWNISNFENIKELYEDAALDEENYQRLLARVLEELEGSQNLVLLLPGHPRVGVTLVKWLESEKLVRGFELKVLPGISSFDTMINDLALDPLEHGAQILDANRVLLFDYQIENCLDSFLYHVCSVGVSQTHLSNASRGNHLELLQAHLQKFYPSVHKVKLLSSTIVDRQVSSYIEFPLDQLSKHLAQVHFGSTLFIPALKAKRLNRDFLKVLLPEHNVREGKI